jgi:hypothetical protein
MNSKILKQSLTHYYDFGDDLMRKKVISTGEYQDLQYAWDDFKPKLDSNIGKHKTIQSISLGSDKSFLILVVQVIVVTLSIVKIILSGRTAFTRILNRVKTKKRRKNIKEFCRRIDEVLFGIQVVIRE